MPVSSILLEMDKTQLGTVLERAIGMLGGSDSELTLDFTSVDRVGPDDLKLLEKVGTVAAGKSARVVLRGINVRIYKALKIANLTERFGFEK